MLEPLATTGSEQERPSEAAECYTPMPGARGGVGLLNIDLEQCNINELVLEPRMVNQTPPVGLKLGPGFKPLPE